MFDENSRLEKSKRRTAMPRAASAWLEARGELVALRGGEADGSGRHVRGSSMISRQWRGLARAERADDYIRMVWNSDHCPPGEDAERAIVPEHVRGMMLEYDPWAKHYEVTE